MRYPVTFIITGILSMPSAYAATGMTSNAGLATSVTKTRSEGRNAKDGLKLDLGAQASSSLKSPSAASRRDAVDLDFMPAYAFTDSLKLSARALLLNSLSREGPTLISDTSVTLRESQVASTDELSLGLAGAALLPTSPLTRRIDSLLFALKAAPRLAFRPSASAVDLQLSYEFGVTRTFYQYGTTEFEEPNTANILSHTGRLSFSPVPRLQLRATLVHSSRWTYEGQLTKALDIYLEESWELTRELSIGLGFTNSGSPLLPRLDDAGFSLTKLHTPTVYGTVGYAL